MSLSLPASFSFKLPAPQVFFIGLAGGADSGKEAFCRVLIEQLQKSQVVDSSRVLLLHIHDFYKELSDEDRVRVISGLYNFDHPDAFDWELIEKTVEEAKEGRITTLPKFDFGSKRRSYETWTKTEFPTVVLMEGIFILYSPKIRESLNMKLFVDVDDDVRLVNRVTRKVAEPHPDSMDHILTEYVRFVKPAFDDFISPTKKWADIIIPRGIENVAAIELITAHAAELVGRQPQANSTRPSSSSRANTGNSTVLEEMISGINTGSSSLVSSTCVSPGPGGSKPVSGKSTLGHIDAVSPRSSASSSPAPRSSKDLLGVTDSQYKPVPQ
ncbi:hypothetical protein BG004_006964 [Podila humilis]|nr:hypothetical protein BG004_006964 [Podila humilis]